MLYINLKMDGCTKCRDCCFDDCEYLTSDGCLFNNFELLPSLSMKFASILCKRLPIDDYKGEFFVHKCIGLHKGHVPGDSMYDLLYSLGNLIESGVKSLYFRIPGLSLDVEDILIR